MRLGLDSHPLVHVTRVTCILAIRPLPCDHACPAGQRTCSFTSLLSRQVGQFPSKCQNDKCEKDVITRKVLTAMPLVYSLVIVHESHNVSAEDIRQAMEAVDDVVDVAAIYGLEHAQLAQIKHVNAYAFQHYVAFTWNEMAQQWLLRDDSTCRVVGPTFEDVKRKCVENRYQPGLLLYEVRSKQQ